LHTFYVDCALLRHNARVELVGRNTMPPILEHIEIDAKTWQKLLRTENDSDSIMLLAVLRPYRKTPPTSDERFSRG